MMGMARSSSSVLRVLAISAMLVAIAGMHTWAQKPTTPPPPPRQTAPPPSSAPAQPPAGQPGQPGSQSAVEDQQTKPDFSTRVDVITMDVIARDNAGLFVSDLKRDDFEVFEDGVKQELVSFTLVHGGRVFNVATPPPPPPQEGIILPPSRPSNDAAGRIMLFFVDDLHLDFRNTGRIRELFKKIKTNLLHEGDMWGAVSTGPSSIQIDVNYDLKRFDEMMKKIAGNGLKPSDIIEGPQGSQGPSEVRYRAHVAFSTAYELVKNLEKVQNRRKALVFVSNGYDFNPFPDARAGTDRIYGSRGMGAGSANDDGTDPFMNMQQQGQQFADADLARELAELTRAANRANVTMYTIDPRGLVGGPDLDEKVDPVEYQDHVRKTQDSLRVIAEETGGTAVVNQNDFDKALKRIDAETSDYYIVGYYSSNPDPTKRHRRIEVKVARKGVNVWSRNAYSLKPTPRPKDKKKSEN
jgi:VWFA-related protein